MRSESHREGFIRKPIIVAMEATDDVPRAAGVSERASRIELDGYDAGELDGGVDAGVGQHLVDVLEGEGVLELDFGDAAGARDVVVGGVGDEADFGGSVRDRAAGVEGDVAGVVGVDGGAAGLIVGLGPVRIVGLMGGVEALGLTLGRGARRRHAVHDARRAMVGAAGEGRHGVEGLEHRPAAARSDVVAAAGFGKDAVELAAAVGEAAGDAGFVDGDGGGLLGTRGGGFGGRRADVHDGPAGHDDRVVRVTKGHGVRRSQHTGADGEEYDSEAAAAGAGSAGFPIVHAVVPQLPLLNVNVPSGKRGGKGFRVAVS